MAHFTDLTSFLFTLCCTLGHTLTPRNVLHLINTRPQEDATGARGFTRTGSGKPGFFGSEEENFTSRRLNQQWVEELRSAAQTLKDTRGLKKGGSVLHHVTVREK